MQQNIASAGWWEHARREFSIPMDWYYARDGQREGPVSEHEFARLVTDGTVRADTLVWHPGMSEWQTWEEVRPTVQLPSVDAPLLPAQVDEHPVYVEVEPEPALVYGGFWIRLLAKILDAIALVVLCNLAVALLLGGSAQDLQGADPQDPEVAARAFRMFGMVLLVNTAVSLAYSWFFLAKFAATPGKLALGLRVVRSDGTALSHGRIVGRYFGEQLSGLILGIGYLIAAFDEEKRTLHDYLCDTRVVKRR